MLYHLSIDDNLTKLTPRIPKWASSYEDLNTKRICFSDSIENCLSALQDIPTVYYVYIPTEEIDDSDIYRPTIYEVRDAKYTHEVWVQKEVEVKCIGKIQSYEYDYKRCHNSGRGRVTYYHYPYSWIVKNV